jgi:cell division protein FtsB
MSDPCAAEKRAYQEARKEVGALRQQLKDLTGSNKPGGGVGPGMHVGTQEQVNEVRQQLTAALERLSEARIALARCTGKPVS